MSLFVEIDTDSYNSKTASRIELPAYMDFAQTVVIKNNEEKVCWLPSQMDLNRSQE